MANLLIITATKIETQEVLNAFPREDNQPLLRYHIGDKTYLALGQFGGVDVYLAQSEMGSGTPGGTLLTTHKAIEALNPVAVILVGIAFGFKPKDDMHRDDQELGQILVAKQIMAYEPGKIKGKFRPRGDRVTCSTNLLDKFRTGELDWPGARVWFGLVLSGEKLIADTTFRRKIYKLEPEAIGGEMEGAGLYTAAGDAKVDWILVKAICDWADGDKNDEAQLLAAKNAAEFVRHVIGLGGWEQANSMPESSRENTTPKISQPRKDARPHDNRQVINGYENKIFVSYAWGGESEKTVDELERAFTERGLRIVRDKKELGYKGSIEAFEQRIGQGQCVILVISDKYLRSEHCMHELVEVDENSALRERVFPIVLADAHIYRAVERLGYIQYWDAKIEELNQAIKGVGVVANLSGIIADLDKYARIRANIAHLTDLLRDMNTLTPEMHAASGYDTLMSAIEQVLAEKKDTPANTPSKQATQERKTKMPESKINQKAGKGSTQIGKARDVNINNGPNYNIQGGIHSGRDTVMGNQTNYNYQNQSTTTNIQTPPEFVAELAKLQAQIAALQQQSNTTNAQRRFLQAAQEQVTQAAAEAQKPQADGSQIKQTLSDAKETMEMLSGGVKAAVGFGTTLAGLIGLVSKLFGG